jgi:hypothetical protein
MQNPNFIVRIPEPCHEDWNKMQPDEKGRFCNSCSKSVFDFTKKTDTEIKAILDAHKDQHVCGHFKKTQIDRPLDLKIDLANLPRNVSVAKAFGIAIFLVFGSFLFSCTNEKEQNLNVTGITVAPKEEYTMGEPMGQVEEYVGYSVPLIDSVEGEIVCREEVTVSGGVGYYEEVVVTDTTNYQSEEVPVIAEESRYEVMGLMLVEAVPEDTVAADSSSQKNSVAQIGDNVIQKQIDLSVYPNPGTGEFTIKYDVTQRADVKVDIYDMKGAHVKGISDVAGQYEGKYQVPVDLSALPPGIYVVSLINNGKKFTEKLVISK